MIAATAPPTFCYHTKNLAITSAHRLDESNRLNSLRAVALTAVVVGALGSVGLLFHASQRRPPLLMLLFLIWVLSPFVALVGTHVISKRWSILARATCYCMMIVLPLASLAIYGNDALRPRKAQAAFVYVLVPPVSGLLIAIIVPVAAFLSGRRTRTAERQP